MFFKKAKETILYIDEDRKYIELCPWCDSLDEFTQKWDDKGYSISHKMCKECTSRYY